MDFSDFGIFRDRFVADGNSAGSVILGGLRAPFGSRFSAGGEVRYQRAQGRVGVGNGFLNESLDLGGLTTQVTFQVEF